MFAGAGTRPGRRSERAEKGFKFYGSWRAFLKALGLREVLPANRTYYVGYNLGSVAISIATPAVVTKTAHGLVADSRVSFSILPNTAAATVSIATPAVVTMANSFAAGQPIKFATTGALPTGITAGTTYYVIAAGLSGASFQFSATVGGAAVNTSGTQSGTHFVSETGTLPTGVTAGQDYYVLATGLTADTFQFSATSGGAAINTSGSASGTISAKTGSDSNDGSANDSTHAFLTPQKAANVVYGTLDLGGYSVTISVAAGTYTAGILVSSPQVGAGSVTLQGDTTTPSNVVISVTSNNAIKASGFGTVLKVAGLKVSTTTAGNGIYATNGGTVQIVGKMDFGACAGAQMVVDAQGVITCLSVNYNITGGAGTHVSATQGGNVVIYNNTVTIPGTPAFSTAFSYASGTSFLFVFAVTFSGSATGVRYSVITNSVIDTGGAGANYLPGGTAGSSATGGQYV